MYANKVTDKEHNMAVDKATRSDTMDVDKANRSVKPLYTTESRLRKVTGAECLKVVGENRADQIRAKKAVKDMKNLANVTHSVKQLSLTERTVARGDMSSKVKGGKKAHQIPAKSTRIGGKFSRSNDSSKAQQVPVESVRKFRRVNINMPDVRKAEKIRLQKAFLEKVVSCPVSEAYLECFSFPGVFTAKLTDEEILKLRDTMDVDKANRSVKPLYTTESRLRKGHDESG